MLVALVEDIFHYIVVLWPIWLPIFLFVFWIDTWLHYKRREWILSQKGGVLLEIKLPKDVFKTPEAMEIVLNGIYEPVIGNLTDAYFKGKLRPWFSLEIASLGGQVKFFIWCLPNWRRNLEARLYAQYPEIEIYEVPDYTKDVHFDVKTMNMTAFQTELARPDIYPIKTYVDYGLNKKGDEEVEKIDPITALLEWMGTLKPGEQAWVQIIIQAHRKESLIDARLLVKHSWDKKRKDELQKFIKESAVTQFDDVKGPKLLDLTKVQQETIEAVQRTQGKLAYDTMIRAIYIADIDKYNSMATAGMIHSFRPFGSANLNGIKPVFSGIDYAWQDFLGIRLAQYRSFIIDAYKRRSAVSGIYKNWNARPYVLTTEELATLFHFPGAVAATPSLSRIPSKKAEAPSNLPV